jgi:antitoxin component YwqK of YwqJK toxin-antitoxin module
MKKLTPIILFSLSVLLISGCGKVVTRSELNFRNGIFYPINSDKPFSGTKVSYYDNGQLKTLDNIKKGKLHGITLKYYKNGQLQYSRNYKKGKLHGLCQEWSSINGELRFSHNYKDGELVE